jgi:hypothetical protein
MNQALYTLLRVTEPDPTKVQSLHKKRHCKYIAIHSIFSHDIFIHMHVLFKSY